jgi:hypothetical protein
LSKMIQGDGEIRRLICIICFEKDEFCGIIKYKLVNSIIKYKLAKKNIYNFVNILEKIFFCDIISISKCCLAWLF